MIGEIRIETLRQDPATPWFQLGYDLFSFDDGDAYRRILAARNEFSRMEILVFVGIWCPDCQEHLPGFARILDAVQFPQDRLRLYGLDRAKTFPGGGPLIQHHGITRLPTFVFMKDGKEQGRIIETSEQSLLKDWAKVLGPWAQESG